jgi:D-alanyl-D-alanine carboxypeptidase
MKGLILTAVLAILPAVGLAQSRINSGDEAGINRATGRLRQAVDEAGAVAEAGLKGQQIPGLALVVMKGDDVLLARGYGLEDAARKDDVTPDTVFELGSMSKQFLAALVLLLAEEGKLSLEDPAARHLPEFTNLPPGLRIRHLLSHTSGMRDDLVKPEVAPFYRKPDSTFAEYLEVARHTTADFAPGARWSYSNFNYQMLTVVVERIAGRPLEQALAERLFNPLGLRSIRLCPPQPGRVVGEARGHVNRGGTLVPHPPENFALFRGPGGYCGSALEMARWTRALATAKVISPRSYRVMTSRAKLTDGREADYGFALSLASPDGARRNGHGGYGGGFSGQAAYYPGAQLTVVVLANRFVFPEHIERKISRRLLGRPEPARRELAVSSEERHQYVGSYDVGMRGWYVHVAEREGRLWFELSAPKMSLPLVYVGDREFVSATDPDGYRLHFSKDGLELRLLGMGMMTWYGTRRP